MNALNATKHTPIAVNLDILVYNEYIYKVNARLINDSVMGIVVIGLSCKGSLFLGLLLGRT